MKSVPSLIDSVHAFDDPREPSIPQSNPRAGRPGGLVPSTEPAVVFSSLASRCVPALADECHVTISEDDALAYRISVPASGPGPAGPESHLSATIGSGHGQVVTAGAIHTPIIAAVEEGERSYHGVVIQQWHDDRLPAIADVRYAQLIVDLAVAVIAAERLRERIWERVQLEENLRQALSTSREIGAALGILMATRHLDRDEAFAVLRGHSQRAHRKLRDVASDVVFTGDLGELPDQDGCAIAPEAWFARTQRARDVAEHARPARDANRL